MVHMHIRKFNVAQEVPIGDLSASNPSTVPSSKHKSEKSPMDAVEVDIPEEERDRFDTWLRDLWRRKDDNIERYLSSGSFTAASDQAVDIPIALKRRRDILDAFCFFIPAFAGWLCSKLSR